MTKETLRTIKQHLSEASYNIGLCADEPAGNALDYLHKAVNLLVAEIERDQNKPDPMGEALNSGDGTYKP